MATAIRPHHPITVEPRGRSKSRLDLPLLVSASLLILVGLLSLFSEGFGRPGFGTFVRQVVNLLIGLVPFFLFFVAKPSVWRRWATGLYLLNLGLLVATKFMGESAGGAQRWIELGPVQFQPSELAKLVTIVTLSTFFANRQDAADRGSTFFLSLVHIAAPAALIFMQPHLGATLVIAVIWMSVALAARVPFRFIFGSALAVVVAVALAFTVPGVMRDYQKNRVLGLLHGSQDEQGKGYQASRAQIAFGTGGVSGTGFLQGPQKRGRFIPEQHTDFIFTVVGEEGGLVGSVIVLGIFAVFFFRVFLVMQHAVEPFHRMLAAGIYGMMVFHTFVNVGMLVGLVPVVGLWLPFMSYGGTALWLCMACVGLLLSIRRQERPIVF